jgi:EAL domain-containing protein (putative c-di-GMP-specific phosphodiesterase class I)/GGDEF domain-containing protein
MRFPSFNFRRLQTRLTVLYAGLFGAVLLILAVALQIVISANARHDVGDQLQSSGAVFERVWGLEADRLQQGGELLAADFGFRQALATGDEATTQSALANLKGRLHADRALILKPDGSLLSGASARGLEPQKLIAELDPDRASSGVLVLDGEPFLAVAAPILAPDPQGWLIFALKLGRPELQALERMASIPINADIYTTTTVEPAGGKLGGLVTQALGGRAAQPTELSMRHAPALVLVRRLSGLAGGRGAGLVLSYPLAKAMAPYERLRDIVLLTGLFGVLLVVVGGWFVARGVTEPVRALDAAAQALRDGDTADLAVEGRDELAGLATSFNLMANTIREREAYITRLAYSDGETGLTNRRALEREVGGWLDKRGPDHFAVAVLVIDRFSHIRGAIGHELSQQLVAALGERLLKLGCLDIARLTTATLGLTFPCESEAQAYAHLEGLASAMRASFPLADAVIDITVTIGFCLSFPGEVRPETLIERASIAVDQAGSSFRRIASYDADAYGDPSRNLSLMSELMQALGSDQFSLAYQPKLDLRRGLITGVEALSRWRHVTRGPLSPDLFVNMAEETGHIAEMTDWVLDRAMADQAQFAARGHSLEMSVNLSGRLLADDRFMHAALERMSGRVGRLCVEITETAVIENPDRAKRNMELLTKAGVAISIDDYGAGLSSLAYLRDIPAQELKIDKAFVTRMDVTSKDALLVRSTVDMAHSLDLKVTAEGVETAATLALLTAMGCDLAQGYYIAKPLAAADLIALLDAPPLPDVLGRSSQTPAFRTDPAERHAIGWG